MKSQLKANRKSQQQQPQRPRSSALNSDQPSAKTVKVLYQRLGSRWFAFSLINNEVFMGSLNPSELESQQQLPDLSNQETASFNPLPASKKKIGAQL